MPVGTPPRKVLGRPSTSSRASAGPTTTSWRNCWPAGPPRPTRSGAVLRSCRPCVTMCRGSGQPLSLLDLGASAGLNLLFDHYRYDYTDHRWRGGRPATPAPPSCSKPSSGKASCLTSPSPTSPIGPGSTSEPLDPGDEDQSLWLLACQWPDHLERFRRLRNALALARTTPDRSPVASGDMVDDLAAAAAAPADTQLCILHTWVAAYLTPDRQAELATAVALWPGTGPSRGSSPSSPYEVPGPSRCRRPPAGGRRKGRPPWYSSMCTATTNGRDGWPMYTPTAAGSVGGARQADRTTSGRLLLCRRPPGASRRAGTTMPSSPTIDAVPTEPRPKRARMASMAAVTSCQFDWRRAAWSPPAPPAGGDPWTADAAGPPLSRSKASWRETLLACSPDTLTPSRRTPAPESTASSRARGHRGQGGRRVDSEREGVGPGHQREVGELHLHRHRAARPAPPHGGGRPPTRPSEERAAGARPGRRCRRGRSPRARPTWPAGRAPPARGRAPGPAPPGACPGLSPGDGPPSLRAAPPARRPSGRPARASRLAVAGPTPHSASTGSGWRKASSSAGRTTTTPGPGRLPARSATGLAAREASLATSLERPTPTEQSSDSSIAHPLPDAVGDGLGRAEQTPSPGHVEERLVEADRLHQRRDVDSRTSRSCPLTSA